MNLINISSSRKEFEKIGEMLDRLSEKTKKKLIKLVGREKRAILVEVLNSKKREVK